MPDRIDPRLLGADGVREAERRAPAAATGDPGPRGVRRRLPHVHPALGVQASVAGGLLPHDGGRRAGGGSTGSGASGSRRTRTSTRRSTAWRARSRGRRADRRPSSTPTARAACCRSTRASPSATARRSSYDYPAEVWSTNTMHYQRQLRVPRQDAEPDRAGSRHAAARRRPHQQRVGHGGGPAPVAADAVRQVVAPKGRPGLRPPFLERPCLAIFLRELRLCPLSLG